MTPPREPFFCPGVGADLAVFFGFVCLAVFWAIFLVSFGLGPFFVMVLVTAAYLVTALISAR